MVQTVSYCSMTHTRVLRGGCWSQQCGWSVACVSPVVTCRTVTQGVVPQLWGAAETNWQEPGQSPFLQVHRVPHNCDKATQVSPWGMSLQPERTCSVFCSLGRTNCISSLLHGAMSR
jgi:hypothetical protein